MKMQNEALVLFLDPIKREFTKKIKLPTIKEYPGKIYYCYKYRSRSGLHWHYCVDKNNHYYLGYVRLLYEIASYNPLEYEDVFKPIPREPKNVVGIENLENAYEYIRDLCSDLDSDVLYVFSEGGVNAYLYRKYDVIIPIRFLYNQANLYIYSIPIMPSHIIEAIIKQHKVENEFNISQHNIKLDTDIPYYKFMEASRHIIYDGLIVLPHRETVAKLEHPEHGKDTVELPNEPLLFLHIRYYDHAKD